MTEKNEFFIEKHEEGYKILRPNAERASGIESTQEQAIERAKEIDPNAAIHIERVRHTKNGRPDHWRS